MSPPPVSAATSVSRSALTSATLNMALRALTLGAKFLLLLALARQLTPADVGLYGVIAGTIFIAVYVLGLDYYVYNTREIVAREEHERAPLIRDQLAFHLLGYAVLLPVLLGVFWRGLVPWRYAAFFFCILVGEHLANEAYRLLVTLTRSVEANILLFLKNGAWVYGVLVAFVVSDRARSLDAVLAGWCVGVIASVALSAFYIRDLGWRHAWPVPVAWGSIRRTALGSLPFFGGSLAMRGVEYSDRYFVQHYAGNASVGVYTFFYSIASVTQSFVITGVLEVFYPRALHAYQRRQRGEYSAHMKQMTLGAIGMAVVGVLLAAGAIFPMLRLVHNPLYGQHLAVLWLLLVSAVLSVAGYIPHYALYIRRRDQALLVANVLGLATSLAANAWLVPRHGVNGAAIASILANGVIVMAKGLMLLATREVEYAPA